MLFTRSQEAPPPCLKSPQPVNIITYVTVFHTGKAEPCVRRSQAEPGSEKGRCEHEDGRMAETIIKAEVFQVGLLARFFKLAS